MPARQSAEPMLCLLIDEPFDDAEWIFEPKFDGLRVSCRFDGKNVSLMSRNGKSQDAQFPDVVAALRKSVKRPAVLDGELVCLDEKGQSSFRLLQQRMHLLDPYLVIERMKEFPAYLYLFDILAADGEGLTGLSLEQRKRILWKSVRWNDRIRWTEGVVAKGRELLDQACRRAAEGIVGKRRDSLYTHDRNGAWVKIKCVNRQELVIGGYTDPQRSRVGLGALLLGYHDDHGKLVYAGKVGTGFTRGALEDLSLRLDRLEIPRSPFASGPRAMHATHWVRPELVAEVAFSEWTQDGLLRQPRFEGLREDKKASDVRREIARSVIPMSKNPKPKTRKSYRDVIPLEEYRRKRDFGKSPEPGAKVGHGSKQPIFVVQEHHASHLHYDFRLEADGVLKSWAIPKKPTLDPSIKRLAVEVEDHPLDYARFEGVIPQGEYGAGQVEIWDRGTYRTEAPLSEGLASGRLEFTLNGKRLKGAFALIRMRGGGRKSGWLLIKKRDSFAKKGARAERLTLGDELGARRAERTSSSRPGPNAVPSPILREKPAKTRVTHPDKAIFPGIGATKGDVFRFYERVARYLLPYLKDRPATLERLPEGLIQGAPHFWQKNTPSYYPDWIRRASLESEAGKPVNYPLIDHPESLLYLVNQGALTFHAWLSRMENLDQPDFVLFDLDPGEAEFKNVVTVALALRAELKNTGVDAFVKTSGQSGLHVLVPWREAGGYDEAREWAMSIATRVARRRKGIATVERSKARRRGKVYIDVMQNAKGHHVVPPYVLRANPGATVSMPLEWRQLTAKLDPAKFNLKTVLALLARRKRDPFKALLARIGGAAPVRRRLRAA